MKTKDALGKFVTMAFALLFVPVSVISSANAAGAGESSSSNPVVSIAGQFKMPGSVSFAPGISLADVIVKSGGFTETANTSAVKITRQSADSPTKVFTVDCRSDAAAKAFRLEAGDIVYVSSQKNG